MSLPVSFRSVRAEEDGKGQHEHGDAGPEQPADPYVCN